MTNDPDLLLKSHGSVARDPTSWLRVGLGCRENRETLLGLVVPYISTQPQSHTHCATPSNCLKSCPPSQNPISLQKPRRKRTCSQP